MSPARDAAIASALGVAAHGVEWALLTAGVRRASATGVRGRSIADRDRRRVIPPAIAGSALLVATAATPGTLPEAWWRGLAALAASFNVVALLAGAASVAAQRRLARPAPPDARVSA